MMQLFFPCKLYFSFVSNSLPYIPTPKSKGKIKFTWNKKINATHILQLTVGNITIFISHSFSFSFLAELTQVSCDCIVMVALEKASIEKIQRAKDLEKLKKLFGLTLLRGKDKSTYIRAIA